MIHLYTGDGKGKTTAAIGLCIRALGRGMSVCFCQFMKGNDTGELYVLEELPGITVLRSEKNFGFYRDMPEADKEELAENHNRILDRLLEMAESGACQLVVLDEVTYPIRWELINKEKLKRLLAFGRKGADSEIELVATGRNADEFLTNAADYLTEMKCVRHPYEEGTRARVGIEF